MSADPVETMLDQLLNEKTEQSSANNTSTVHSQGVIKRINYSHKAMIDMILANPGISQNALAATFGYSVSWISQVMSSDAFQSALAERSADIIDPTLRLTVEERFKGLALRSMEILQEKLSKSPDMVPDQLAVRVLEVASRAAGYGAKQDTTVVKGGDVHIHLEELGGNLTKLLHRKKSEAIDAEVLAITAESGEITK